MDQRGGSGLSGRALKRRANKQQFRSRLCAVNGASEDSCLRAPLTVSRKSIASTFVFRSHRKPIAPTRARPLVVFPTELSRSVSALIGVRVARILKRAVKKIASGK